MQNFALIPKMLKLMFFLTTMLRTLKKPTPKIQKKKSTQFRDRGFPFLALPTACSIMWSTHSHTPGVHAQ